MLPIETRLRHVARRHVLRALPHDTSGELEGMVLDRLLVVYGNWRARLIDPRPRRALQARELAHDVPDARAGRQIGAVCQEIERGDDLTPRLSRDVAVAYVPTAERKRGGGRNRDVDPLLAHSGLHHLHIGEREALREAVRRDGPLLFAAFTAETAYIVGLFPHGRWGRRDAFERLVRNWPESGVLTRSLAATRLAHEPTDDERTALIAAGCSLALTIDGALYSPPGQTGAGTPTRISLQVMHLTSELEDLERVGLRSFLAGRGADPDAYWSPAVRQDLLGLESDRGFQAIGRLS